MPLKAGGKQETERARDGEETKKPTFKAMAKRGWQHIWLTNFEAEARFAGWVSRFTFVLATVGAIQAWAFIESERAFVNPVQVAFGPNGFGVGKKLQIAVTVENGGRAAAVITKANITAYLGTTLPTKPPYKSYGNQTSGAIAPGGNRRLNLFEITKGASGILFDDYNVKLIQSGSAKFFIFGYVRYRDEYSFLLGDRRIGYCSVFDPNNTSGGGPFEDCQNAPGYVYLK